MHNLGYLGSRLVLPHHSPDRWRASGLIIGCCRPRTQCVEDETCADTMPAHVAKQDLTPDSFTPDVRCG